MGEAVTALPLPFDEPVPRSWMLEFPPGTPVLSLNDRLHHMARHRLEKQLQNDSITLARHVKVPHCERIHVVLVLHPKRRGRRDLDNLSATLKPCIDGIRRAGVVEDDDSSRVTFEIRVGEPSPKGTRFDLIITDMGRPA